MLKVLYGCCYKGVINAPCDITYVDIIPDLQKNGKYICEDIRNINFNDYDIIVCSPPCNYYSRANYRRNVSSYAQQTKDLLPYCINEAIKSHKPFLIENVINRKLMKPIINKFPYFIYYIGRHTYFTSEFISLYDEQIKEDIVNTPQHNRQGGINVQRIIDNFVNQICEKYTKINTKN